MQIIIGADIVPTASNQHIFENAQMEQLIDNRLMEVLRDADYRIFNLEVPLTNQKSPIKKCGPNLIASTKSVVGLKQLGADFLTLANNHILDQGEQGLWSTVEQLESVGIAYAGIGHTPYEAAKPYIVELEGKKIGIYCCAEHEFSIVTDRQAGANPFDPLESLDHIENLKKQCDYVICLYHGGKEHYRYPSPNLQKICRKIIEKGADLVICQHTHCIGCVEKWKNGNIVYGQGNFLFDNSDNEYWQTSILVSVNLDEKMVEYIPIQKVGNGVKLAVGMETKKIMDAMIFRSEQIRQKGFLENSYKQFADSIICNYMSRDSAWMNSLLFRVLNKVFGHRISQFIIQKRIQRYRLMYINQYECEAHRELILKGLEVSERE